MPVQDLTKKSAAETIFLSKIGDIVVVLVRIARLAEEQQKYRESHGMRETLRRAP